jgi:hypothetical protein
VILKLIDCRCRMPMYAWVQGWSIFWLIIVGLERKHN